MKIQGAKFHENTPVGVSLFHAGGATWSSLYSLFAIFKGACYTICQLRFALHCCIVGQSSLVIVAVNKDDTWYGRQFPSYTSEDTIDIVCSVTNSRNMSPLIVVCLSPVFSCTLMGLKCTYRCVRTASRNVCPFRRFVVIIWKVHVMYRYVIRGGVIFRANFYFLIRADCVYVCFGILWHVGRSY